MEIPIPGKMVFILKQGPENFHLNMQIDSFCWDSLFNYVYLTSYVGPPLI